MTKPNVKRLLIFAVAWIFAALACAGALAESYTATSMRLLRYEGTVEIEDESGNPRFIMENARFASKILTMDADSRVEFVKQSNALKLTLTEGSLFLDVQEKLDANETLEIQTSTMLVGIRGTIVFLNDQPAGEVGGSTTRTTLQVLEGTAQVTYEDQSGQRRSIPVPAGSQAVLEGGSGQASGAPEVSQMGN